MKEIMEKIESLEGSYVDIYDNEIRFFTSINEPFIFKGDSFNIKEVEEDKELFEKIEEAVDVLIKFKKANEIFADNVDGLYASIYKGDNEYYIYISADEVDYIEEFEELDKKEIIKTIENIFENITYDFMSDNFVSEEKKEELENEFERLKEDIKKIDIKD